MNRTRYGTPFASVVLTEDAPRSEVVLSASVCAPRLRPFNIKQARVQLGPMHVGG